MRKAALFYIIVSVIMFCYVLKTSVWADELAGISNGDKVNVFGDIVVDKKTNGDIVAVFGSVDVQSTVQGDVVAIFGDVSVKDEVNGDVVSIFGDTTIKSRVLGEVVSIFGNARLQNGTVINGELISIGTIEKDEGARVLGQEIKVNIGFLMVAKAVLTLIFSFLTLIFGLIIISIFKKRTINVSLAVENQTGRKIALGILGFLGFTILMIFLSVIVVGPLLYMFLLIIAEIAISIYLGKQIFKVFNADTNVYVQFITGLITISILKILLTTIAPQIGFVTYMILNTAFDIFLKVWGIGILIDTRFGSVKAINSGYAFDSP